MYLISIHHQRASSGSTYLRDGIQGGRPERHIKVQAKVQDRHFRPNDLIGQHHPRYSSCGVEMRRNGVLPTRAAAHLGQSTPNEPLQRERRRRRRRFNQVSGQQLLLLRAALKDRLPGGRSLDFLMLPKINSTESILLNLCVAPANARGGDSGQPSPHPRRWILARQL